MFSVAKYAHKKHDRKFIFIIRNPTRQSRVICGILFGLVPGPEIVRSGASIAGRMP